MRSFDVFLDLRRNKQWANNRDAGDLGRHCAQYDVTVIHTIENVEICPYCHPLNKTETSRMLRDLSAQKIHDDVIKWKHFPRYWPFVRGIHRPPENSPHKGQWRGALMFRLICPWINRWVNNREAGDLRRHRTHCDVIVMKNGSSPRHAVLMSFNSLLTCAAGLLRCNFFDMLTPVPYHCFFSSLIIRFIYV